MRTAIRFLNVVGGARALSDPRSSQMTAIIMGLICLFLPGCNKTIEEEPHNESHKITATTPESKEVILSQPFVCQIHSQRHIEVRALETGYLEAIEIKEGQVVKQDDVLFTILPTLYQSKLDAENAEAKVAQLQLDFNKKLFEQNVVSSSQVFLTDAKLAKAKAKAQLAAAEYGFTFVRAPFDGIVDHLKAQQGSLVKKNDVLTTLSDNSVMWAYFKVSEKRYLEFVGDQRLKQNDLKVELVLANGTVFDQLGKIAAVEADFDNSVGVIPFRADFPNPDNLLRHGQTGTVVVSRAQTHAVVIPQRATFEIDQKRYVYVIDPDDVVHRREIEIENELEDVYVIKSGLAVDEKIVLEGIRQIREGQKVEYESRNAEQVKSQLKFHAE